VLERVVEKEAGLNSLAQQPSLHVGEGDDEGVDRARLDLTPQLVQLEHRPILYENRRP